MNIASKWNKQIEEILKEEFGDKKYSAISSELGLTQYTLDKLLKDNKKKVTFKHYCDIFNLLYYELIITRYGYVYAGSFEEIYSAILIDYGSEFEPLERSFMNNTVVRKGKSPNFKLAIEPLLRIGFEIKFVKCID